MKYMSERDPSGEERPRKRKHVPTRERTWPEEIEGLLKQTHHWDPQERRRAVLARCPCNILVDDARVWDRLIAMATDKDVRVRADVFHTLCDGSPRSREAEIAGVLQRMQHDPDPKLRRRVRQLLAHYRAGGRLNIL